MKDKIIAFVFMLCLSTLSSSVLVGQDLEGLQQIFKPNSKTNYQNLTQKETNELKMALSGLFLAYKSFLSSQDGQSCSFHPSCSVYAIQSIQKKGLILGGMNGLDRLTRCNGFSPQKYEVDLQKRLLLDPVK